MRVEWHDRIEELAAEWDALADRAAAPPWVRPGWIAAWWQAFGRGRLALLAVRDGDRLTAILPLVDLRSGLRSPTNWHTPAFGPVAEGGSGRRLLARALLEAAPLEVRLAFVDPDDAGLEECRRVAEAAGYRVLQRVVERPPYIAVDGDWTAYAEQLDTKLLADLRRRRRKLEREHGEVALEIAQDTGPLAEGFRVEAAGWKGEQGTAIVSRPETRAFYEEIGAWAAERGWLRLHLLRVGGRAIAFEYMIEADEILYRLKGGFEPDFGRFAPGKLLLEETLERGFAAGLARFEFLGSDEPWKLQWTETVHELQHWQAFAPTGLGLAGWLAYAHGRPLAKRVLALRGS